MSAEHWRSPASGVRLPAPLVRCNALFGTALILQGGPRMIVRSRETFLGEAGRPRGGGRPAGGASRGVHEGAPPRARAQGGAALGLRKARAVTPGWPRRRGPASGRAVAGAPARVLRPPPL